MGTLSIHNLDPKVERRIRDRAKRAGKSINQTVKEMLEDKVGLAPAPPIDNIKAFEKFCGVMTEEDWREAEEIFKDFERIDPEDWQ